jgi:anti-sigma-K factor RskA
MARTATRQATAVRSEDGPPLDPEAVSHAYRLHRARRHARDRRRREQRWASARFWLVLVLVVAATAFLALRTMGEIERVFGL